LVKPEHKWRLQSIGLLLAAMAFFGCAILADKRHTAWAPWAVLGIVFFIMGARKQQPRP